MRLSACRPDSRFHSTSPIHSKKMQKQKDTGQIFLAALFKFESFLVNCFVVMVIVILTE